MSSTDDKPSSSSSAEARLKALKCHMCGQEFDDMAEMQRHTLTEHIQKGELPKEEQRETI
jgi:hypothetical protein